MEPPSSRYDRTQNSNNENPYVRLMRFASAHALLRGSILKPLLAPHHAAVLTDEVPVHDLRQQGIRILPWTTNDPSIMRRLVPHVDGLITDRPDVLQAVLAKQNTAVNARDFEVSGHRGARGLRPENTLPAFEAALDHSVDSVEVDVVITADEIPLIWHDPILDPRSCRRLDGSPYTVQDSREIGNMSLQDVQTAFVCDKLRFGSGQANDLLLSPVSVSFAANEHLTSAYSAITVEQLFRFAWFYADYYSTGPGKGSSGAAERAANASKVLFNLEAKVFTRRSDELRTDELTYATAPASRTPEQIVGILCGAIRDNSMRARVRIMSFDFAVLVAVQELYPDIQTCYLTERIEDLLLESIPAALRVR